MLVPRALLPPDTALGGSTLVMSVSVPVPLQASSLPSASGLPSPPPPPAPFSPLKSDVYLTVPIFNRRADLLALTISFMAFSWICSVLRLYVRLIVVRAPGWDDLFMTLALICTSVCSITLCIGWYHLFPLSSKNSLLTFSGCDSTRLWLWKIHVCLDASRSPMAFKGILSSQLSSN